MLKKTLEKSKADVLGKRGSTFPKGCISLEEILEDLKKKDLEGAAGAIYSFTGTVRSRSLVHDLKVVEIEIECWEEKADEILDWMARDVQRKFDLVDCRIYHGIGRFRVGEDMVYVVTASAHRKEGHEALMHVINRYKEEVPIWKKEIYEDGSSQWISKKKWKMPVEPQRQDDETRTRS